MATSATNQKKSPLMNGWLWLIGLMVIAVLWRWLLLIAGGVFVVLAVKMKTRREIQVAFAIAGALCLVAFAVSLVPSGAPPVNRDSGITTEAPPASAPSIGPSEPPAAEPPSAPVANPTPAPAAGPTQAENWASGITVVQGKTTWQEYAQLLPTEDIAPSKMKFTGFLGDERLWTTTFKDGSTANAIFDKNMVLDNFDTDTP